ncbi:MAG: hypothetical protein N7Q72_03905, partial [Spiroplasma sp. Tabriz.8]|nr:hypothetical protein [Spiroplasma sp. Tabriz.8]
IWSRAASFYAACARFFHIENWTWLNLCEYPMVIDYYYYYYYYYYYIPDIILYSSIYIGNIQFCTLSH